MNDLPTSAQALKHSHQNVKIIKIIFPPPELMAEEWFTKAVSILQDGDCKSSWHLKRAFTTPNDYGNRKRRVKREAAEMYTKKVDEEK